MGLPFALFPVSGEGEHTAGGRRGSGNTAGRGPGGRGSGKRRRTRRPGPRAAAPRGTSHASGLRRALERGRGPFISLDRRENVGAQRIAQQLVRTLILSKQASKATRNRNAPKNEIISSSISISRPLSNLYLSTFPSIYLSILTYIYLPTYLRWDSLPPSGPRSTGMACVLLVASCGMGEAVLHLGRLPPPKVSPFTDQ